MSRDISVVTTGRITQTLVGRGQGGCQAPSRAGWPHPQAAPGDCGDILEEGCVISSVFPDKHTEREATCLWVHHSSQLAIAAMLELLTGLFLGSTRKGHTFIPPGACALHHAPLSLPLARPPWGAETRSESLESAHDGQTSELLEDQDIWKTIKSGPETPALWSERQEPVPSALKDFAKPPHSWIIEEQLHFSYILALILQEV